MAKLKAKDGANAVDYRRSLLLSAAIATLVTATAGVRPANAQSVTGSGLTDSGGNPISAQSPSWTVGDDLHVGDGGTGSLTIQDGGVVENNTGFVGYNSGDQGTVTVSGTDASGNASTWTNNGDLVVGQSGNGTLKIENGGQVTNNNGYIGAEAVVGGGHSDVTVSGTDASGHASTWTSTQQLFIGDNGTGSLSIQDGGVVNTGQTAVIGLNSDGTGTGVGTVTVSGRDANGNASTLNVTNTLSIGEDAQDNRLDIQNGGVVNSGVGEIGDAVGSKGTATVSGTDASGNASTWNNNNIYTGYQGNGTLNIKDGGAVNVGISGATATAYIGYFAGSQGTVNVWSSTGNVSTLTTTNDVEVGVNGAGTLNIGKGGMVSSGTDVTIAVARGSSGILNLTGDASGRGILATSAVNAGAGTATLNLDGGILRATQDNYNFLNGFAALTVGAGGAYFDTNTHDITIGTSFSGSSGFNKLGLGTLTLTGDSSAFAGTTTISAGTLQLGDGGTRGNLAGNVTDNGTLAFNRSDTVTFSNLISGTGAVSQVGSGTTVLTAANSYNGGTAINGGTLQISSDVNLGDAAGGLSFDGGTLHTTADISNSRSIAFVGDGTLATDAGTTLTLGGRLSGTGAFAKTGDGTVVLTGDGSGYTGATMVSDGALIVNGSIAGSSVGVQSGATLAGNGSVGTTTVLAGGTIAPGNNSIGTLRVNGAFAQNAGSTYQVQVDPNSNVSDMIAVVGAASLANGAVLNVSKGTPGNYQPGTLYTVLSAANGVSGTYQLNGATVSAYLSLTDSYDANHAYLTVIQTRSIGDPATTPNQTVTAGGVASLPSGNPVATDVLNSPTDAAARTAFDQLSGEIHASEKTAAIEDSHFVRDAAVDRIREAFCAVGATAVDRKLVVTQTGFAQDPREQKPGASGCAAGADRFTVWGQVFGSWGRTRGNGNADSLDHDTGGFFTGIDAPIFDSWRAGILTGYGRSDFNVNSRASSGSSDDYYAGLYDGTQWGALGLRTGLTYTTQDIRTGRSDFFPGVAGSVSAGYNAATMQIFGDLGYKVDVGSIAFEPFANFAYVKLHTNGFSEQGGAVALTSRGGDTDTSFSTLGLRGSTGFVVFGTMSATARGSLGWRRAFGDITPVSVVSLAGGNAFSIAGVPIAVDEAVAEAGFDLHVSSQTTIGLSYSGQFGSGATDQSVRGDFTVRF
jgi:outer membrane autotransporter protein